MLDEIPFISFGFQALTRDKCHSAWQRLNSKMKNEGYVVRDSGLRYMLFIGVHFMCSNFVIADHGIKQETDTAVLNNSMLFSL